MYTVFIDEEGNRHTATTQQYEVGTYVIIDSDPSKQFGVEVSEKRYHEILRSLYKFIPEESSLI